MLLSVVTLGILYGPLSAGLYVMAVRRVRQNRTAEIGDVFWGLSHFWRFFGAALLLLILIGIGFVFLIIPGLLLATIWIYTFPVMVDRDMGVFDAMAESRRLVRENGFGQHLVMVLLLIALSIAGSVAGGLGHLLTLPLTFTIITAMYFAASREEDVVRAALGETGPPAGGRRPGGRPAPTLARLRRRHRLRGGPRSQGAPPQSGPSPRPPAAAAPPPRPGRVAAAGGVASPFGPPRAARPALLASPRVYVAFGRPRRLIECSQYATRRARPRAAVAVEVRMTQHLAHWDDAPARHYGLGPMGAMWQDLGKAVGSVNVGLRRLQVDAGRQSTPVHVHDAEEEIFFILRGSGFSWQGSAAAPVRAGDCIVHAAGAAPHTLIGGEGGVDALVFGTRVRVETCRLPRAGVAWLGPSWIEPDPGEQPWQREAAAGVPDTSQPAERDGLVLNVDEAVATELDRGDCRARDARPGGRALAAQRPAPHDGRRPARSPFLRTCTPARKSCSWSSPARASWSCGTVARRGRRRSVLRFVRARSSAARRGAASPTPCAAARAA